MATVTHSIPENQSSHKDEGIRKRTRATAEQLTVLEDTFAVNVSPNSKLRKQLSEQLKMTDRSIQIWFQNRRAKVKHMQKRAQLQLHQASMRAQLYHYQQQHYYLQQHYAPHQRAHSLDSYKYHRSTAISNSTATSLATLNENGVIDQQRQSVPPPSLPYAEMVDLNPDPWAISVSPSSVTTPPFDMTSASDVNISSSLNDLGLIDYQRQSVPPCMPYAEIVDLHSESWNLSVPPSSATTPPFDMISASNTNISSSLNDLGLMEYQRQSVPPCLPYAEIIELNSDPWNLSGTA